MFKIKAIFLMSILIFSILGNSSALLITVTNQDTGNNNIAPYGEVKIFDWNSPNNAFIVTKGTTANYTTEDTLSKIDLNSNDGGLNAHIDWVGSFIKRIKEKYNTSHDFSLESTVNFYKKGKGYKNKVRIVTVKWLDDKNTEHFFSTGSIDKIIDSNFNLNTGL
ncbi:MAG: hypothetical protein LBD03_04725 [Methanobrevibacter sp.]|jgi:hypothetical protein|nr:hypothetical protein [Candidatus Methanovirga procula]